MFLPGVVGSAYLLSVILLVKQIGFALMFTMLVAGQLLSAVILDHVGYLGIAVTRVSRGRVLAFCVVLGGTVMSVLERVGNSSMHIGLLLLYCLIIFAAGFSLPVVTCMNRHVSVLLHSHFRGGSLSFFVGSLFLAVVSAITSLVFYERDQTMWATSHTEWWMYMGGLHGCIYVTMMMILSSILGVTAVFLLVMTGQLTTSLVFDNFGMYGFPTVPITTLRLIGVALVILGNVLDRLFLHHYRKVEHHQRQQQMTALSALATSVAGAVATSAATSAAASTAAVIIDNQRSQIPSPQDAGVVFVSGR